MKNLIKYNLIDAVIGVTYQCNSRCVMCNIWRNQNLPSLSIEELKKLPKTLKYINLSGGEPFLHPQIVEIVKIVSKTCPRAKIIISSNGFATELIGERMKEILKIKPNIGVSLSLDGIGAKHEEVRRVSNAYQKVINTLKELQKFGLTNLRLGFTAGDYNIEHLSLVYDLAKQMGVEMTLAAVHNSDAYFKIDNNKISRLDEFQKQFSYVIRNELKTFNPKRWLRAYFTYGLLQFIKTGKRILPSLTGKASFYLDPDGNVFPSDVSGSKMGNLKNFENFDQLMQTEQAQKMISENKDQANWMICTARASIRKHPLRVAYWVLKNKLWNS